MDMWSDVRRRVLVCGESKRSVQKLHKIHWKTLDKILAHSAPPGYRPSKPRRRRRLEPFISVILQWLEEDKASFGNKKKSIAYHLEKHGIPKGMTAVSYTQRAMANWADKGATRRAVTDARNGSSLVHVESSKGVGLYTPHGRIIWFHPR